MTREPSQKRKPRWASRNHAAEYMDCSVDTISRLISAGDLPGHKAPNGKTVRIDLNDIDDMLLQRSIPSRRSA